MRRTTQWVYGWLLLLPALALLVLFTHYPDVANLWHSFFSTPKGARPAVVVGLDNYRALAEDPIFWQALVNNLVQLMVMPDALLVENYRTMTQLGLKDTILAIGLPYFASAFGIFLLRQAFKTVPKELDEAARVEGCTPLQTLWKVYIPLARPTYLAYALVSVSYHWNNFLWPLIITNSVESRPVTGGLQVFSATDQGIDWSIINAATLLTTAPLLIAFLLFQRQFVQSFMRAGIK